jgi:TRAP-type C4-dicarboxylate transport system permease small subunit
MRALLKFVDTVWDWAIALIVFGLLVVVTSQIIDRHFLDLWSDSPEEYVKIGLVWLTFLGFALAMRHGTEIRVDIADHFLPLAVRHWIYGTFDVLLLVVIGVAAWKAWLSIAIGESQVILGTGFSVAVPTWGMFIGIALMFVVVAVRLVRRIAHRPGVDEHDASKVY